MVDYLDKRWVGNKMEDNGWGRLKESSECSGGWRMGARPKSSEHSSSLPYKPPQT